MPDNRSFQLITDDVDRRVRILEVHGEADRPHADALSRAVEAARADGRRVIIDLSHALFLDSSMLAALVGASHDGRRRSEPVVILCESARLRRALDIKGLRTMLEVAESRDEALERASPGGEGRPDAGEPS